MRIFFYREHLERELIEQKQSYERQLAAKDQDIRFFKEWIEKLHTRNEQMTLSVLPIFGPRTPTRKPEEKPTNPNEIRGWPAHLKARMAQADREDASVSGGKEKKTEGTQAS